MCERRSFRRRIIPARAGFTANCGGTGPAASDHPRSRGVYLSPGSSAPAPAGSSPLARGLPEETIGVVIECGIIPARAGFTARTPPTHRPGEDHPRSRGVYRSTWPASRRRRGSSPLARGLRTRRTTNPGPGRIIPARAGFTFSGRPRPVRGRDHPRSRGVYSQKASSSSRRLGSSPLARGLRSGHAGDLRRHRIIPARAGFTPPDRGPGRRLGDHPRSRGVYWARVGGGGAGPGSSPLARGLRPYPQLRAGARGIIPARAGFTRPLDIACRAVPDHPRSRGVYRAASHHSSPTRGSSPLARGLPAISADG